MEIGPVERREGAGMSTTCLDPGFRKLEPMERDILTLLISGWTSPLEALQKANCLSLAQRVSCLSRLGFKVEKQWKKLPSGKTVRAYRALLLRHRLPPHRGRPAPSPSHPPRDAKARAAGAGVLTRSHFDPVAIGLMQTHRHYRVLARKHGDCLA